MFGRPLFCLLHHLSWVIGSWKFDIEMQEESKVISEMFIKLYASYLPNPGAAKMQFFSRSSWFKGVCTCK